MLYVYHLLIILTAYTHGWTASKFWGVLTGMNAVASRRLRELKPYLRFLIWPYHFVKHVHNRRALNTDRYVFSHFAESHDTLQLLRLWPNDSAEGGSWKGEKNNWGLLWQAQRMWLSRSFFFLWIQLKCQILCWSMHNTEVYYTFSQTEEKRNWVERLASQAVALWVNCFCYKTVATRFSEIWKSSRGKKEGLIYSSQFSEQIPLGLMY